MVFRYRRREPSLPKRIRKKPEALDKSQECAFYPPEFCPTKINLRSIKKTLVPWHPSGNHTTMWRRGQAACVRSLRLPDDRWRRQDRQPRENHTNNYTTQLHSVDLQRCVIRRPGIEQELRSRRML